MCVYLCICVCVWALRAYEMNDRELERGWSFFLVSLRHMIY